MKIGRRSPFEAKKILGKNGKLFHKIYAKCRNYCTSRTKNKKLFCKNLSVTVNSLKMM